MLYSLLYHGAQQLSALGVTRYLTFRAIVALLCALTLALALAPWVIARLRRLHIGQVVRHDGPQTHLTKAGTPTMGGILILLAVVVPTLLWMDLASAYVWSALALFCLYGALGCYDDYTKITRRSSSGVRGQHKLVWQTAGALALTAGAYATGLVDGVIHFPFVKTLQIDLGLAYVPFASLVIVGSSNAVNLTDGLDGLAIGSVMICAACYALLCYITGHHEISEYLLLPFVNGVGELTIFAAALFGASIGFLWYNAYPAQLFMGDVGSLPLGGALGTLAVFSKHEILLVVIGGVFVAEALSVMTQVISFRTRGKRVFRMAPIHHHFELAGWPEPKVIVRFWIVSLVLALIGLLSLKIR